jgi:predicted HTH transcriptional regulator
MEERLQKALEFANYRQTLNNQLQKIKVRAEGMLIFAKNGGSFTINRELICFLDYVDKQGMNDVALLDDNNLPVQIDDVKGFLSEITKRYFEVTSDYFKEYQEVRRARNVKTIIDLKD